MPQALGLTPLAIPGAGGNPAREQRPDISRSASMSTEICAKERFESKEE